MANQAAREKSKVVSLARRLRTETSELHRATEVSVGIPERIRDRAAYERLLVTSLDFYAQAQAGFEDARWEACWIDFGIRIEDHDRTPLLALDLAELNVASVAPTGSIAFESFAQALGWLYVVEGSSLGGRFLAPVIIEAIGAVPTAFYRGDGRSHPRPWRSLQAALATFDESHADTDAVIAGAIAAFTAFGETVAVDVVEAAR